MKQPSNSILAALSFSALTAFSLLSVSAVSHAASSTEKLEVGNYVEGLSYKRYTQPYVLQRLTDRTYMVSVSTHNATFYVSDKGVLVFDPLSSGYGQGVIDAIKEVTDLPITALVYSRFHLDYLSDAQLFVDAAKEKGKTLRIIASKATAEQVTRYGNPVPVPTDVVQADPGSFNFDGLTVSVQSTHDTHSIDNTMFLLEQEKVLHYLDTVEPQDLLPYFRLVGVLDIAPMEQTLKDVKKMDWVFMNAGHSNIGYRKDIDKHLELIADIRNATGAAMGQTPFDQFINPKADVLVWVDNFHKAVADKAIKTLEKKYGKHPRFDAVMRSHVELMISNLGYYHKH